MLMQKKNYILIFKNYDVKNFCDFKNDSNVGRSTLYFDFNENKFRN